MKRINKIVLAWMITLLSPGIVAHSQTDYTSEIKVFQEELNTEFANPEESPLKEEDLAEFKALDFFPIDSSYRVEAEFVRSKDAAPFKMETTTARRPIYEKYGEVYFTLAGNKYRLNIYQSHDLREKEEYRTYLFLLFTDQTNGSESYGGGRFIDLQIPDGEQLILDFNKAYNPYCAYNAKYSCPIPPKENDMPMEIRAGVKKFHD
ncbi:hypothetical protein GCM10007049_15960 [Echinicola pacifica]|uniref:DUF1684 domain-containing protein n=1 Tax=Echinicola pacifica TaxID=346377 RepID=A0A918PWT8_9BACT|nr:DUF1684 domain-containing protein [Echinicola pacifica]GGZ23758.1 hypothetical protein GCM10007049_15960 [Echinicola pacifica]